MKWTKTLQLSLLLCGLVLLLTGYIMFSHRAMVMYCNPDRKEKGCIVMLCNHGNLYCYSTVKIKQYCLSTASNIELYVKDGDRITNGTSLSPSTCPVLDTTDVNYNVGMNLMFFSAMIITTVCLFLMNAHYTLCRWFQTYAMDDEEPVSNKVIDFARVVPVVVESPPIIEDTILII